MNNNIFRRVEQKYILSYDELDKLLELIKKYIKKDEYYQSTVLNLYFDNIQKQLFIKSISQPIYKFKIRLRSYNVPKLNSDVYLEMKNKYQGITTKRRIKIKLSDFYKYLKGKKINNTQIFNEIDYYFKYLRLKPSFFVAYDRNRYTTKENENIKITIDKNLRSRKEDLFLEKGDFGKKFFDEQKCIMEIKSLNSLPIWLTSALSSLKIYPVSFSKYGETLKKENKKC